MNTRAIRPAWVNTLGVALALASGAALATSFRLTDLGTLGGSESFGVAMNASGQVTGRSTTAGGETHAFLWNGTTMLDFGEGEGRAINASGQATGYVRVLSADGLAHAFLWDGTLLHDLGTLGDLRVMASPLTPRDR